MDFSLVLKVVDTRSGSVIEINGYYYCLILSSKFYQSSKGKKKNLITSVYGWRNIII